MTRRRLLEILVAASVLVLLVAVFLVRPTARRTEPPPVPLFHRVSGALPDLGDSDDGQGRITARSPDGVRTAMLFPVEFEEAADLYVLTGPVQGVRFTLADSVARTQTPKNVGWIDPQTLWVVVGHRWGTVSPGGDVHAVDPVTGEGRLLWACPDSVRAQAIRAEPASDGMGILLRLNVFDEQYLVAHDSTVRLTVGAPPGGEPTPAR